MSFFKVEFSKTDNGWVPKKQTKSFAYTRVANSPSFSSIEETETWIRENHRPKDQFDRPWIDHKIGSFSGNLIPLEEWKQCCDDGGFIDYDGYGDPVDENYQIIKMIDENGFGGSIYPSDYTERAGNNIPPNTKYILWYNR
jgi:hypothetical protein